jgi:hypothetical protein
MRKEYHAECGVESLLGESKQAMARKQAREPQEEGGCDLFSALVGRN